MSAHYPHGEVEAKWQKYWLENKTFRAKDPSEAKDAKKFYALDMFPYPSGAGLHVGHPEGYTATDILTRYKLMKGYNVLHPMGWDAFGLPAEQHALDTGTHPRDTTAKNIDNFRKQIQSLGMAYDWDREVNTTDPKYYRWTQWIFLKLFEKGLAYQAEVPVWWCPALKTVLANEEVVNGLSERGNHPVERRPMRQWMLKITAYAERLLEDLEDLDWPESIKAMQRHWIGRSEGMELDFAIDQHDEALRVFTTRVDTLFGVVAMVLAPEHPLLASITTPEQQDAVKAYQVEAAHKSDLDRTDLAKGKTGVFTGAYAINPASSEKVPIYVSDYVLMTYGTGAVMVVPGHDERDREFALAMDLPIKIVVADKEGRLSDLNEAAYTEEGLAVNSGPYTGLSTKAFQEKLSEDLEKEGLGQRTVNYRLRDWLFSRQRYWGEPIPILHDEDGGIHPVRMEDLPLTLPEVESYAPSGTGESPLATIKEWVEVEDPKTGQRFRRETNTMPQWAGSCWYYLRYIDPMNDDAPFSEEKVRYWLPVDIYVGGAEHAVLHLLYARFWHKVLYDCGLVFTKEPFQKLVNQGMILGSDGQKMSKSRGNVVNPDDIVARYGADAMRLYEMFMGPLESVKPWKTNDIVGIERFLDKLWKLSESPMEEGMGDDDCIREVHRCIQKVSEDIPHLRYNTAIAALMVLTNHLSSLPKVPKVALERLVALLNPFAPHIAEEIWVKLGHKPSISEEAWPSFDPALCIQDEVEVVAQVNGKIRGRFTVSRDTDKASLEAAARELDRVKPYLEGATLRRVIVVPNKLVNFVVA